MAPRRAVTRDLLVPRPRGEDPRAPPAELDTVARLCRVVHALGKALELLLGKLRDTGSNAEFLIQVRRETAG